MPYYPSNLIVRRVAQLILKGRYGRACRLWARAVHTSPRLLPTRAEREAWARKYA